MLTRRYVLHAGLACGAFAFAGAHARLAFAALPDDRRFIVVILRGGLDGLAGMPAPDEDLLARVGMLYAKDPVLAPALKQALATRATANAAMHDGATTMPNGAGQGGYGAIAPLMEGAGKILAAEGGPRIAVFD